MASCRAGNVIGGGDASKDRIVPDCMNALRSGESIVLRNPQATRPWQHVLDPLCGYLMLASRLYESPEQFSGSWNFGPEADSIHTVREVAEKIISFWGNGSVAEQPQQNAPHEAGLLHLCCDKARHRLGWRLRWEFDRAMEETVRWYKEVHAGTAAQDVTRSQIEAYERALVAGDRTAATLQGGGPIQHD